MGKNLSQLIIVLQARYKALVALLGGALVYLQGVQATNPNKYVSLAIVVLTAVSVHQVSNRN